MATPLQARVDALRAQHLDLQAQYQALESTLQAQASSAQQWQAQRNRDLEAEAQEHRKAETLQRVFYRIAERATADLSLYEFLQSVHALLGELLYAKNCYVCLYNPKKNTLDFPYYVDEKDGDTMQCNDVPSSRGLTEYVLRTGKPQLIDAARFQALQNAGEITDATGDLSFSAWLGVPMQMQGALRGVLVVQSYESRVPYTEADAHILSFVANHFSTALERYQAIDEVRKSEERYRLVIESVGVGVAVVQDGRMVFVNPALVHIVGHPRDYMLAQPFTAILHPEDVDTVVQRHERRLRDEPVEHTYNFRIHTSQGEVRTLELTAVKIEWGKHDATLLFVVDATARMQAEETQRIAMQKQSELNDMKSRFITMASHEFRTPLATIHGSVELLLHYEDRMQPAQKNATLQRIDDAVERMTHMLENVLVIGRADADQMQFKPQSLAIQSFCLGLLEELRSAMARQYQKIRMVVDLPDPDAVFSLDDTLLRNIVGNLLSNALKYSPDGGEVRFSVQEQSGTLVFTVADQGIGIPEADQPRLFETFHRASNVGPISGTGLGLSIVKEAVLCHKGRIEVHSQVGMGSRFTVTLPVSPTLHPVPTP
jgi:PAS domain S-box-containing protein